MGKTLIAHPGGRYLFLPGIAPYSSGVIATPGSEVVHVTLAQPLAWHQGLLAARSWLESRELNQHDLCGVELRCPEPHSLGGFSEFNQQYQALLEDWEMLVDGENPVARTNVSPVVNPPNETQLFGFSFVQPGDTPRVTFVVAGGGELPHRDLERQHIVRLGETTPDAIQEKARCVLGIMRHRLDCLKAPDEAGTMINVYTAHPLREELAQEIISVLPQAAHTGFRWNVSRPPVQEIEFEMNLRGVIQDLTVDLRNI